MSWELSKCQERSDRRSVSGGGAPLRVLLPEGGAAAPSYGLTPVAAAEPPVR